MFIVHISTVITWLCMPEMSVLKGWKYGKRSSQCSSGNNNNNVNAFLTCTTQEALFGSYNSSVNLFSPFSALSVVSRTAPVSPLDRFVSVCASPSYMHTMQHAGRKSAKFFDTRGIREHDEPDGGARRRNETDTEEDGFARAEEDAMSLLCIAQSLVSIEV